MLSKIVATTLGLALATCAQTLPPGVQKKSSMAGITEYGYPNGLRVLLFPDPSSPKITVNAVYLVGSRHEGYGESGMAHLLEHMNFILTTDNRKIKDELTAHGANWNGTTDNDRTNYFETFTATDENLKWALSLEADRMVKMRMEKALLDTEMTVVRNEFERGENSPQRILSERVASTAYLWHNYGKSTIGSRADIEKVPIDRLAAFYRKYYQPDNAVVVIAGQIDPAKTLALVASTLGAIPRPERKLEEPYTVEPTQDGERTVQLRRVGNGKIEMIAWHGPAMAHDDSAALEIFTGILNGANGTGRLAKALVDNKLAVSARISSNESHDPGLITATATLSDDQSLEAARKALLDTVSGMVSEPPSKDEVDRVKTRALRAMDRTAANSQQLAMALTETIADGDWRLYFANYDELKKVTVEDVVRVGKLYFKDSNRTIGEFIPTASPDRTDVPVAPEIEAIFRDYKSSMAVLEGEAFDPSPANIEKHIERHRLANGMTLALLPKSTRGGTASAALELRFGDEKSLVGTSAVASLTASMLMRGTKTKTRQQIQDAMDKLNATVSVGGGGGGGRGGGGRGGGGAVSIGSVPASIQAKSENLVPALRLAVEILREPAFPESDFEQIKKQQIAGIENGRSEPATLSVEALQKTLSPFPKSDIRYVRSIDERIEDIQKVTLDDVRKFHAEFYGASHADLVVVGQFDPAELQKAAAELLGSWNSSVSYARIPAKYLKTEQVNLKIETPDKQNAQFEAGVRLRINDSDPDYPAMVLANYIFGGSITGRLPDRVRNREGLSYSVNSGFSAASDGDAGAFSAAAIANPQNMPKVEASFRDELAKTVANGFTADEVAAGKKALLDALAVGLSQDQAILARIRVRDDFGRTLAWDADLNAKIAALSADQVNAAFRRHVDPGAVSIVKAGDFKAAAVYR